MLVCAWMARRYAQGQEQGKLVFAAVLSEKLSRAARKRGFHTSDHQLDQERSRAAQ
jgi:hypothetical protein